MFTCRCVFGALACCSVAPLRCFGLWSVLDGRDVCSLHAFVAVPPTGPYVCIAQENEGTAVPADQRASAICCGSVRQITPEVWAFSSLVQEDDGG